MSSEGHDASSRPRLLRSRSDRVLTGTAAGIAAYADADPAIVRTGFVVLCFLTLGLAGLAYAALAILMPEQKEESDPSSAPAARLPVAATACSSAPHWWPRVLSA